MPSILVLEQDPRSLERIHQTLGAAGWRVRIVSDPAQAFAAAQAERPDLVIVGASVSGSASVAGTFTRRSGGPGVLALLPPGTIASGFDGLPADELLPDPFSPQELMAAVQRAGTAPKAKPAAPAPAAPRPESKLTSLDIFGDVLAEIDGDEPEPAPAPVVPQAPPPAAPSQPVQPVQPAAPVQPVQQTAPVQPAAPLRPAPRPSAADDDLNAQLEKTLTGVFGADLMRTRPATPAPPPPAPPVAQAPAAAPVPPRPVPPRRPEPAGGDDDIDAILSRTLGNLDPAPRRPPAPAQPPRPAAPPVSPTAPPAEGTAVRRPATAPTAMDQLEELTRNLRSPAPPAAPQPPRPAAPLTPVAPAASVAPLQPVQPTPAPAPPPQAPPVPVFSPAPEPEPEPEPESELILEPLPEPLEIDPPSSSSPFGSDPFDLTALELPPPAEEPEPAPEPTFEILDEEPVFELEMEPEVDLEFAPEPVAEPVAEALPEAIPEAVPQVVPAPGPQRLPESQPGTVYEPVPFPAGAAARGPERADRPDIATTQRIPVTLDDTLDIPGAERFGQYTLLEKIAAGGMAEVWKARMRGVEGFQKTVAIKKILPHMTDNSEFIGMFIDEAKLAAQLSHPNIVHIYDLGKIGRDYYIAMEYVEGKDLRSILNAARRKGQPLPLGLALLITSRLASALDYAHRKRDFEGNDLALVHRDVSPQNVLITLEGDVKLCDFGIAKAVSKAGQTQMGALKGKLQYMSPEQAWGRAVDSRSDIFSLGAVLFEMITGERLFSGDTEMSVLEAVRQGRIRTPRDVDPSVPPAVDEIVARALAYEVGNRFQSAGEMMQRIEAVLHEMPPSPGPSDLAAFLDRVLAPEPSSDVMFMPQMPRFPQSVQPVPPPAPAPGIPAPSAHAQVAPGPVDLPESLFSPQPSAPAEAVPVEAVAPVGDVHMEEPGGRKSRLVLLIAIVVVVLLGVLVTFFLLSRRGSDAPPPEEAPAPTSSGTSPGATVQPASPVPAPAALPAQQPSAQPAAQQAVDYEEIMQEQIKKGLQEKEAELRRKYEKKLKEEMARAEKASASRPAEDAAPASGAETSPPPR